MGGLKTDFWRSIIAYEEIIGTIIASGKEDDPENGSCKLAWNG
jgi:hypothetical protein